jgi:hypothetical protein
MSYQLKAEMLDDEGTPITTGVTRITIYKTTDLSQVIVYTDHVSVGVVHLHDGIWAYQTDIPDDTQDSWDVIFEHESGATIRGSFPISVVAGEGTWAIRAAGGAIVGKLESQAGDAILTTKTSKLSIEKQNG